MKTFLPIIILLWATPLLAQTNTPISAIDWLSQPSLAPLSDDNLIESDPPIGALLEEVTVIELDTPEDKIYGLIPANISGIQQNFWTDLDPNTVQQIIRSLSESGLPATDDLLLRALLADSVGGNAVLRVRAKALIERGAVYAAYNLLGQSQIDNLENFNLFSEASLLTDNFERMCSQLNAASYFSNDEALQVYCHARAGSWNTAVLKYFTLDTLGAFAPTTSSLLAAYLDPELANKLILQKVDYAKLTPLEFKLLAGVDQPVSTKSLPLKFAASDLSKASSWRQQIEAAERLSVMGSLSAIELLAKYKSGKTSASGGIWDRVFAVQQLDRALEDPIIDPSKELRVFWTSMKNSKLAAPLARAWADKLIEFGQVPQENEIFFQMQVLSRANAFEFKPTMARLHRYNPNVLAVTYENLMLQLDQEVSISKPFRSANMLKGMRLISDALKGNESALFEAILHYQAMGLTQLAKQLVMEFMILAPSR